jgi:uncharacterized membrane protein
MDGLYSVIRVVLAVMGVLLFVAGTFFALQGAGIIMWPADSFMLKSHEWVARGIMLANFGLLQIYIVRRR